MFKKNIFPVTLLVLVIALFYGWTFSFEGNYWLISLGTNVLQIVIGMLGLIWFFQAYRNAGQREKNFWLFLSIGLIFFLSSNWILLYQQITQGAIVSEGFSYIVWLFAYLFFLAALISKTRELSTAVSRRSYGFNIAVFMITVASINFHYLINPVLERSQNSVLMTLTTIAYPISDLTILFVITILYYLLQKNKNQQMLLFCIAGFFIQIIADFLFAYTTFHESYQPGHFVDLLWILSTLFIGLTGYYARVNQTAAARSVNKSGRDKTSIFPYISILVLLILVFQSYQYELNALSAGLVVAFLLVLVRQIQILRKNHQLVEQYRHLAYHDVLTGLRNRGNFKEEIERMLADCPPSPFALLLLDLDKFKAVNDTIGHHMGDLVLIETARKLEAAGEQDALIFRLGGDEFILLFPDATRERCITLASDIVAAFREPMEIDGYKIDVTPSIGISSYPEHGDNSEKLMQHADAAMYLTKENGRNGFSFYQTS